MGADFYLCEACGQLVRTRGIYYGCKEGRLNRTGDFVRALVVARLQKKDLRRRKKRADPAVEDTHAPHKRAREEW